MEAITTRSVLVNQREIKFTVERKPVKNLNLRIHQDGSVHVSVNDTVPYEEIDTFVRNKSNYIIDTIQKFKELALNKPQSKKYVSGETFYIQGRGLRLKVQTGNKDSVISDGAYIILTVRDPDDYEKKQRLVNRFLKLQCNLIFTEVINNIYPIFKKYNVSYPQLRIRKMETRWGSCSAKRSVINLNVRLIEAPRNCIEYVVMHEFCHFIHPNHSKYFYEFLTMLMPDWRERKELLDKYAEYWL